MKNEKVFLYVVFLQLYYANLLYPEYEIGRPYLPYIEALWEEVEFIDG